MRPATYRSPDSVHEALAATHVLVAVALDRAEETGAINADAAEKCRAVCVDVADWLRDQRHPVYDLHRAIDAIVGAYHQANRLRGRKDIPPVMPPDALRAANQLALALVVYVCGNPDLYRGTFDEHIAQAEHASNAVLRVAA